MVSFAGEVMLSLLLMMLMISFAIAECCLLLAAEC